MAYAQTVRCIFFFFSSRRRHTRCSRDWSSDVCSSDLWHSYSDSHPCRRCDRWSWGGIQDCPKGSGRPLRASEQDRKSVGKGKGVDLGGRRIIKKKKKRTR